uniref:Glutamate dehydrogenase n=1 Tax=Compsopogon caeruleus TaxID=31354 RepID=A0A7S1XBS1_9RHOD|mmetsp:Transcript_1192/g.2502  ORF Transcript_1192/g.2502 Transcript_1192/m.2502 type:complete len:454 (+) Transcript_1192:117-1478(+)|eukprot:CAMPEP_0184680874 /NCGR_PEP_ID=MMETSP0312-20130426/3805_1 /TAXON_ID=31354 /ORGANISM="Compsopogon coeruleus, Strain SAG 36.94" /LENGTH=453 /DNA_ID=CAMNT_0027131303 /DNA_START=94 /DNA_END=1455 /DNA_ORIENTATION=+
MASEVWRDLYDRICRRDPDQPEFQQAVLEVLESLTPVLERDPTLIEVLEELTEPDRIVQFRVSWEDDKGRVHVNRGYRVQFSSAIGPYKGGLRFHPSVNQSVLKFLGFEQIFKNSLTTLPLGGAKGGSDFDPKGKTNAEIRRFCYAFMAELARHIGPDTDVPAGDIGVGGREIGYLFGAYRKLRNEFVGVLTGKGIDWGGSLIRTEATGYGLVYFVHDILNTRGQTLQDKRVLISGSGNVAQYAAEKAVQLGARVLTMSDSSGWILDRAGIDEKKLAFVKHLKNEKRGRIREYAEQYPGVEYYESSDRQTRLWAVPADVALPCATQNEVDEEDARAMVENRLICLAEGANMPCTPGAIHVLQKGGLVYAPGKASNAGGVATSGLEMAQNSGRIPWSAADVDGRLRDIMRAIHEKCSSTAKEYGREGDYLFGANVAGFLKVAAAIRAQGLESKI